MKRMIPKPQPLYDTPPKDPIEEFFDKINEGGGGSDTPPDDDAAKKAAAGAGDVTYNFPDEEWVPPAIRGKTAKEAAELMKKQEGEFTKVNTSLSQATKLLDQVKSGGQPPPPKDAPPAADSALQDVTLSEILEMKVDRALTANPDVAPYRDEIVGLLSNISDARIRLTQDAMILVMNQIRGNHHKEILEGEVKKATAGKPPTALEGTAFGGTPPRTPDVDLSKIDAQGKANLAGWFEGDLNKARESLLPPKE